MRLTNQGSLALFTNVLLLIVPDMVKPHEKFLPAASIVSGLKIKVPPVSLTLKFLAELVPTTTASNIEAADQASMILIMRIGSLQSMTHIAKAGLAHAQ